MSLKALPSSPVSAALDVNATAVPSALITGVALAAVDCPPPSSTLSRVVTPFRLSRRKMSATPLVSPGTSRLEVELNTV